MCGRYYLDEAIEDDRLAAKIGQALSVAKRLGAPMKTSGEMRPTDIVPVLAPSAIRRAIGAFPMQWGFAHPTKGMLVFNTRSETASQKALFCTSIDERRCLIPASGYYEWQKTGRSKTRCTFTAETGEPLYLAGLYIKTSARAALPCFSILTQQAAPEWKHIHPRMPVIVPYSRAEEWLSPDTNFDEMLFNLSVPVQAAEG